MRVSEETGCRIYKIVNDDNYDDKFNDSKDIFRRDIHQINESIKRYEAARQWLGHSSSFEQFVSNRGGRKAVGKAY